MCSKKGSDDGTRNLLEKRKAATGLQMSPTLHSVKGEGRAQSLQF